MSTYGLDGVLPWTQARHVAASCARPLEAVDARLDEAGGHRLARPVLTLQDDPAEDSAAVDGYAVRGEGPWVLDEDLPAVLTAGHAARLAAEQAIPRHADAVLAEEAADLHERADGQRIVYARDPLTGLPDEHARPDQGDGIVRQAQRSGAGTVLAESATTARPALLALAAAAGHDGITIVRPPVVGLLVLGNSLLDRGVPRRGRVRDALGPAIPSFVGVLGARGNPAIRAPDTEELLLREIDDAAVDVLITTGSTAPGPDSHLRRVLRDLGAHWLVDGVAATPGAQMLLARLTDGRLLVGLPGDPAAALSGLVTLVSPLLRALRDDDIGERTRTAVLMEDAPLPDYAEDTVLAPVSLQQSRAATQARPLPGAGPAGLGGWAVADAIAVVPPGLGARGDEVEVLDPWGRADWPGTPLG